MSVFRGRWFSLCITAPTSSSVMPSNAPRCHPVAYYDDKIGVDSNANTDAQSIKQVADGIWKEIADTRLDAVKFCVNHSIFRIPAA
ncbi:MAG: hypothetical protein PHU14_09875 [Methylovulum sp.]|nr:hypothetical protein [Methylovulum sp.]